MKEAHVDPQSLSVRAQAGLLLGELDRATQAYGLATPLGVVSVTGIAGLTLGGGIGWLNGKYGLACDNVLSVDIITADGEYLTANADNNPDLYLGHTWPRWQFWNCHPVRLPIASCGTCLGSQRDL